MSKIAALDPVMLARIQFAFTISFHIIFPSFTIGLASWLAVVEGLWLKTKKEVYKEIYQLWVKIFAVAFGMGVVSGVVMSYQFGTNWSGFAAHIGNVLGPLLGFEVLTAFFLEASFLGIMLYGWGRVSARMHFMATVIVALGTLISSFWILSANSWMQTPTGFEIRDGGIFYPTSWLEIIFNPSFPYRLVHMVTGTFLTTAFVVGGVGAWYLRKQRHQAHARIMVGMAMLMAIFVAPMQLVIGDLHGLNTLEHQPAKVAAMEGIWENEKGAALRLFGWPDEQSETTKYSVEIPKLASLILKHDANAEITGLKSFDKDKRPPAALTFWSFRIMVGLGLLMILTGLMAVWLHFKGRLFTTPWFQRWCILMAPSGFIAVISGWFVTEVGRQPYVVYNLLRTGETVSPVLGQYIFITLIAFVIVYAFVFGAGTYYIFKLIRKGITGAAQLPNYGDYGPKKPLIVPEMPQGGNPNA